MFRIFFWVDEGRVRITEDGKPGHTEIESVSIISSGGQVHINENVQPNTERTFISLPSTRTVIKYIYKPAQ